MFASKVTKRLEVAGEDGSYVVVIRKLSGNNMDKAAEERQVHLAEGTRALGPEVFQLFRDMMVQQPQAAPQEAEDETAVRLARYDRKTVLMLGIIDILMPDGGSMIRGAAEHALAAAVEDLDAETAQYIFEEIINLSAPPKKVAEAAQEKD